MGDPGEERPAPGTEACWPTSACSACPTPASRPSSARSRRPSPRSPTTRSPRCTRTSAWSRGAHAQLRDRRHPRPDRRRGRWRRPRHPSCATCSAPACCCTWSTSRRSTRRPPRSRRQGDRRRAAQVRPGAAGQAALAGAEQARPDAIVAELGWTQPWYLVSAIGREGTRPIMLAVQAFFDRMREDELEAAKDAEAAAEASRPGNA
jgi:hypothetical protein